MSYPTGVDPQREVELKLEVSPEGLRRLQRHPLVRSLSQGRAVTRTLDSVYFDTRDADLARAGFGLRVRSSGAQRVQTLKGERSAAGGLFERSEFETPIEADEPDLALLPDPALRARLREIVGAQRLEPVFRTEFRRTRRLLRDGETEWTLDADLGEIVADDLRAPIAEIELELRAGSASRLFEFARELQEQIALRPSTRSKAERGYALARGEPARSHRASKVSLPRHALLEDALAQILSSCLAQVSANATCAEEGVDPEGVHQMRVGVRRFRAALAAFSPVLPEEQTRLFRSELRWLGRELGTVRDLDVFLVDVIAPLASRRAGDPAFKRLRDEAMALRAECRALAVGETLRAPRYARLVLELGGWIAGKEWRNQPLSENTARLFQPAREYAGALLEGRLRKVRRLGVRIQESDEVRHALRIQTKKLRYLGEFFRSLYPQRNARKFLRRTSRLQSALGTLNDVATAERILGTLLQRVGPERSAAHDRAAGFVEGWTSAVAESTLHETGRLWNDFEAAKPFWR